ncbi:uncharacterized protein [Venturia canescens]|uniref:uncharacterized protein isoform X2 n=1 Tax=Venturia canescens TaxID=32260 RepID=UPI001C9D3DCB|nr:uncharacterized protein LOC122409059 isoform X2 [Venturia canescens]
MSLFERSSSEDGESNGQKKQKLDSSQEKNLYTPIKSLTQTQCCPSIRGVITSTSKWRITNRGTYYANFVLEDDSGQIEGVIFRTKNWSLEKQFVVGAKFIVAGAVVKPVNPDYQKNSNQLYELSIPNVCETVKFEGSVIDGNKPQTVVRNFDPTHSLQDLIKNIQPGESIDIVGLVIFCEPETFSESQEGYLKCRKKIIIRDIKNCEMEVVIHGRSRSKYEFPINSLVVLKNAILEVKGVKSRLNVEWTDFHLAPPSDEMHIIKRYIKPAISASVKRSPFTSITSNTQSVRKATPGSSKGHTEVERKGTNISTVKPGAELMVRSTPGKCGESNFTKINVILDSIAEGSIIDVVGVVTSQESPVNIKCSNGMKTRMSALLSDETGGEIRIVVWGPHVEKIQNGENIIIAAKRVRVHSWNNSKELNCMDKMSSLVVDPGIDEVKNLREWLRDRVTSNSDANFEDCEESVFWEL